VFVSSFSFKKREEREGGEGEGEIGERELERGEDRGGEILSLDAFFGVVFVCFDDDEEVVVAVVVDACLVRRGEYVAVRGRPRGGTTPEGV